MYALSLHEAEPGHHYQFQYMIDAKVPIHKIFAVSGNAFVEGWALYAESLGEYDLKDKLGLYKYVGRLTYEMFRAVRLVVDTGMHYYGWSFAKCLRFMSKHLAMSRSEIITELERYACIPGQALAYKIGELTFQRLKKEYLQAFQHNKNAIKEFHKIVLEDGVLPLKILEDKLRRIISQS